MQKPVFIRSMLLDVLKERLKIATMHRFTDHSQRYRLKAQALGREAEAAPDDATALKLVHDALAWIQLAENEELIEGDVSTENEAGHG